MKKTIIKVRKFGNAILYKLTSKSSLKIIKCDDEFVIRFKILDTNPAPRVLYEFVKGKLHITTVRLSREAVYSIANAIEEFKKDEEKKKN